MVRTGIHRALPSGEAAAPLPATTVRRRVQFNLQPTVALYRIDSPPVKVLRLGQPREIPAHGTSSLPGYACSTPWHAKERSATALMRTCHSKQLAMPHGAQDSSPQKQWQLVKPRYWWQKGREKPSRDCQTQQGLTFFKNIVKGKCYNCFSANHLRAQCREPTKCWRCKRQGQSSYQCKSQPSARSFKQGRVFLILRSTTRAIVQPPHHPSMERRRSFRGASAGSHAGPTC